MGSPRAQEGNNKLSAKDLIAQKLLRMRCLNCLETPQCKFKGLCDECSSLCEQSAPKPDSMVSYDQVKEQKVEDSPTVALMPRTQTILDQNEQQLVDPTVVSSRNNFENQHQTELVQDVQEIKDKFYTIGAFKSGPMKTLLVKLLNISKKDDLDSLVVLAKSKSDVKESEDRRPVIMDTAHVFTKNNGPPETMDVELHKVNTKHIDIGLTSKLDEALDKAIKAKKIILEDSHLTTEEVDFIVESAINIVSNTFENFFNY